jgi:glycerol-3-phosphate dehydrogenase
LLGEELGLPQAEIDRQVAAYVAATEKEKSILTGAN